jgi:hypothetical protein
MRLICKTGNKKRLEKDKIKKISDHHGADDRDVLDRAIT